MVTEMNLNHGKIEINPPLMAGENFSKISVSNFKERHLSQNTDCILQQEYSHGYIIKEI